MQRRLASFFALLLCITYSITYGVTSVSAGYKVLDDLPINPSADLDKFKEEMPSFDGGLLPTVPEREPELVQPDLGDWDPYGAMLFSMNDYDNFRSFTVRSGSIRYGNRDTAGNYVTLSAGDALSFVSKNGSSALDVVEGAEKGQKVYGYIEAGTSVDIEVPFEAPAGKMLIMSGSGMMGLQASAYEFTPFMYPDSVSIIVNGIAISSPVQLNDMGVFAFSEGEYEIENEITSIGYRFTYDTTRNVLVSPGPNDSLVYTTSFGLLISFNDATTWEFADQEPEYNGILESIIGWLSNLWGAIVNLPANIGNFILDGLKALFLPSEADISDLSDRYNELLSTRLGFIYQSGTYIFSIFEWIMGDDWDFYAEEFSFPGISIPLNGESVVIVESCVVSLDNDVMDVLRPVCGTIVSFIAAIGVFNIMFDMLAALISGVSYFEFLKRRKDDDVD